MKEIFLTQGQVALVDDKDFEELNRHKWCAHKSCRIFYAQRMSSRVDGKRYTIHMHHEIIGKPPKGFETDHENGRGLDNQRHNLRHVTSRQNGQNLHCKKTSQYPGVYWYKRDKKWAAKIMINGKTKHLGLFADELEAFKTYKQAVESLGEEVIGSN